MIQLLVGTAAILGILFLCACIFALSYRKERDEVLRDVETLEATKDYLSGRVETMRGDIATLEKQIETLRAGHDALVIEKGGLERKLGRMEAEARAAKPKRGPNGKFVAKPKPATVTPISGGRGGVAKPVPVTSLD